MILANAQAKRREAINVHRVTSELCNEKKTLVFWSMTMKTFLILQQL